MALGTGDPPGERQSADSFGCRPSVQGPPAEAWASFGKSRDHLENLKGIPCHQHPCVCGEAIPQSPFLAPNYPTKTTVTSQGRLYPRGRSRAGIQAPSVPPPRLRPPCSGHPGRPGHLRGLGTTSALRLLRPRGGSAPPQAGSTICRCPEEGTSVWMGAVQLSGRPCQSRAPAQSPPPCLPARPPLGNPCHQPGPLISPVHWLWGLDSPPPESNPTPGPHPSSRPPSCTPAPPSPPSLEVSQAQSHGHPLRPRFEPASAAAWCTPAPGAPEPPLPLPPAWYPWTLGPRPVHSWLLGDPQVPGRWAPPVSHIVGDEQREGAPGPRAPAGLPGKRITTWKQQTLP